MKIEKASCGCKLLIWDKKDGTQTVNRYFCKEHQKVTAPSRWKVFDAKQETEK